MQFFVQEIPHPEGGDTLYMIRIHPTKEIIWSGSQNTRHQFWIIGLGVGWFTYEQAVECLIAQGAERVY